MTKCSIEPAIGGIHHSEFGSGTAKIDAVPERKVMTKYSKEIVETFIEMNFVQLYCHWDDKGDSCCPLSPAELAFFMRDKCNSRAFSKACGRWSGNTFPGFLSSEDWIEAAVYVRLAILSKTANGMVGAIEQCLASRLAPPARRVIAQLATRAYQWYSSLNNL